MNIWWILSFHCLRGCQTHKSEHFGTLAHWQVSELYLFVNCFHFMFCVAQERIVLLELFDILHSTCVSLFSSNATLAQLSYLRFFITEEHSSWTYLYSAVSQTGVIFQIIFQYFNFYYKFKLCCILKPWHNVVESSISIHCISNNCEECFISDTVTEFLCGFK